MRQRNIRFLVTFTLTASLFCSQAIALTVVSDGEPEPTQLVSSDNVADNTSQSSITASKADTSPAPDGQAVSSEENDAISKAVSNIVLSWDDLLLPPDAQKNLKEAKTEWAIANIKGDAGGLETASEKANGIREQYKGIYYAADGSIHTDNDIISQAILTGDDLLLPKDAQQMVFDDRVSYIKGSLVNDTGRMNAAQEQANGLREQYKGIYYAADGSTYNANDIVQLGGLIFHEAAPDWLDMFMVCSTGVNRLHCGYWGNTVESVLRAPGQYFGASNPKYQEWLSEVQSHGWTKDNNVYMYIANLCLSGQFTTPSNVYGQAAGKQGILFMYVNNKQLTGNSGYYNHQYCTMFGNQALSTVDWAGRPARDAEETINLVNELMANAPAFN